MTLHLFIWNPGSLLVNDSAFLPLHPFFNGLDSCEEFWSGNLQNVPNFDLSNVSPMVRLRWRVLGRTPQSWGTFSFHHTRVCVPSPRQITVMLGSTTELRWYLPGTPHPNNHPILKQAVGKCWVLYVWRGGLQLRTLASLSRNIPPTLAYRPTTDS